MNRDEAKLILQAYRPGGRDAQDPYFAQALAMTKADPELAAWFADQQRFDLNISTGLQQLRVPSRLKAEILAREKPESFSLVEWWRRLFSWQSPVAWATAMLLVLAIGMASLWKRTEVQAGFSDYSAQMVNTAVNDQHHVDVDTGTMKEALAWFSGHHGENNLTLPTGLSGDQGLMGCRVLAWHGKNVSMLCYSLKGKSHVDVFVADADIVPDAPPEDSPRFAMRAGLPTMSWSHGGKVYLAVSHGSDAVLKGLFSPVSV